MAENGLDARGDAVRAYEAAMARLELANSRWEEADCPMTTIGSQGQEVVHPMWKVVCEAEGLAAKLRERVAKQHRGPVPSAVVGPRIKPSPAARLRAVGD